MNKPVLVVMAAGMGSRYGGMKHIGALRKAGLAVAMGNANNQVKAVSDVIVSDNDHDGCAEIIKKYIL